MSEGMTSAFEQVTRQQVKEIRSDLNEYKQRMNGSLDKIDTRLEKIDEKLENMTRTANSRPNWITVALITALTSLSVGLIIYALTIRPV